MRILFIGDTHNSLDISKISPEVVNKLRLNEEDVIIHCGDIGVPWNNNEDEMLDYWSQMPCPVIVCLGNHENYNWIESKEIVDKYGGMGYQMSDNIFAPLIGSILTIFNKKFWFYPGGYSIDYRHRTLNQTIFKQELPLKTDSQKAIQQLLDHGPVDVIISHDGPREFVVQNFGYPIGDIADEYLIKTKQQRGERVHPGFELDKIISREDLYTNWYFGHHHKDFQKGKVRCLMHTMVLWDVSLDVKELV